ncbi:DUF979 family protein [Yersinia kristensenii]|uniref:5-oxoproline transporter, DUF979 family subunit n=1 Tax=Yersinia kristensenii TaxID=28152 RepID=UPI001C60EAA5|nr:DUF979 family protein [Yersinia kristensenii]MBW5818866.1 DUF979 family protein [Yersinia kristensenii]MBW5844492.1 DUF979 family protein [Yersinia kristensenii]MDA5491619.1 DUF979 family protein [Yersinia kristensenii]
MITIEFVYIIIGILFFIYALTSLSNKKLSERERVCQFLFWGGYSATYFLPGKISDMYIGVLVIFLVLLSLTDVFKAESQGCVNNEISKVGKDTKLGKLIFIPALSVPLMTITGIFISDHISLIEKGSETLVMLSISTCLIFIICIFIFREKPIPIFTASERIMGTIGINVLLPQMLAMLGGVILALGVGGSIAEHFDKYQEIIGKNALIVVYAIGMFLLSVIMGNAFAAFPIMTAGIGMPIIVDVYGGNPALLSVLGMLCGFCGTMLTPMAANFNIIPEKLLGIKKKGLVIKEQAMTAIVVLFFNIIFMIFYVYK